MGIAGKTSTMKGTILTVLALLVASCQMKPTKPFLVDTKTKTNDNEPTGEGEDYQNIMNINSGNINVSGSGHSNIGNKGWNAGGGGTNQNLGGNQFRDPYFWSG